ncbi:MAG: HAD family hydrolase [Firmicutes bacterium]|nr:HAD family hydrolase [Bacillota bacterium]
MEKFSVISIDMFQTLVNVHSRRNYIWKRILRRKYTEKLAEKYSRLMGEFIYNRFHEDVISTDKFVNLKSIFKDYFNEVFLKTGLKFSSEEAAKIWANEHTLAVPYPDTIEFFKFIGKTIPICLVSDSGIDMIFSHVKKYKFYKVFISEEVKAYKNQSDGDIFKKVINYYNTEPEKILHIGDSSSDIIGANRVGIKTCWVNKNKDKWKHDIKPTYIINFLRDISYILGLEKENKIG